MFDLNIAMLGVTHLADGEVRDLTYFKCGCGLEITQGEIVVPLILAAPMPLGHWRRATPCSNEHAVELSTLLWGDICPGSTGETIQYIA